jgi:hypothetical protein
MRASARGVPLAVALLLGSGCETIYGPASPSRDWVAFESPRYVLNARPGSFCEAQAAGLAEVLEDQYDHTVRTLQIEMGARISVFLYNSGAELEPSLPSPRSGVAFSETNAFHAVCVAPFDNDLRALIAHEANHVIVHNGLGRAGTSFMNEGLASALVSERFGDIGPASLHRWVRTNPGRVMSIAELADDARWNANSSDGYRSSASFLAFLIERHGAEAQNGVSRAIGAAAGARSRDIRHAARGARNGMASGGRRALIA